MSGMMNAVSRFSVSTAGNVVLVTVVVGVAACALGLGALYLIDNVKETPAITKLGCLVGFNRAGCPRYDAEMQALKDKLEALVQETARAEDKLANLRAIENAVDQVTLFETHGDRDSAAYVTVATVYSRLSDPEPVPQYYCYIILDAGPANESRHFYIRIVTGADQRRGFAKGRNQRCRAKFRPLGLQTASDWSGLMAERREKSAGRIVPALVIGGLAWFASTKLGPVLYGSAINWPAAVAAGLMLVAAIALATDLFGFIAGGLDLIRAWTPKGNKGTAGWTKSLWSIRKDLVRTGWGPYWGVFAKGWVLGSRGKPIFADFESCAVSFGTSGSGKGVGELLPTCMAIRADKIIPDFKAANICCLKGPLEARGEKVRNLNIGVSVRPHPPFS